MDVAGGLVAIGNALGIVKELRDIERGVDEAAFRLQLAELTTSLADAKIALSEAKQSLRDRDERISELERELKTAKSGDICPLCREGTMKVTAVRPHQILSHAGIQEREMECSNVDCRHRERRMHDPNGILEK